MQRSEVGFKKFRALIRNYYHGHKRDFQWRRTKDPYKILISEVMLQQTQTERVIPKYQLFVKKFPNFETLYRAPAVEVLKIWQGLGYNRRALFLKRLAHMVNEKYAGTLPGDPHLLTGLPGIGTGTAGAVAVFAFNIPRPFIETNIRRVFINFFFQHRKAVPDSEILPLVEKTMDRKNPREWFWALMDYGAMLAKVSPNPNRKSAHYKTQSPFKGSDRELRGKIVKLLLAKGPLTKREVSRNLSQPGMRIARAFSGLEKDGLIHHQGMKIAL